MRRVTEVVTREEGTFRGVEGESMGGVWVGALP